MSPTERFARLCKLNPKTGCVEWIGCFTSRGYGCFAFGGRGKNTLAHRWAAEFLGGMAVSKGTHIHHACENPKCVNPAHLTVVTPLQHAAEHSIEVCKNGHPLSGEHLTVRSDGRRRCRTCNTENSRRTRERVKGAPLRSWARRAA